MGKELGKIVESATEPTGVKQNEMWLDTGQANGTRPLKLNKGTEEIPSYVTVIPDTRATNGGLATSAAQTTTQADLDTAEATITAIVAGQDTGINNLETVSSHTSSLALRPTTTQVNALEQVATCEVAGWAATATAPIFVAPTGGAIITAVYLLSGTATTGSDGTNNHTFMVTNVGADGLGTTDLLAAAKTTNGADIGVLDSYSLGTIQNGTLTVGQGLKLVMTVNAAPTSLATARVVCVIHYKKAIV